MDQLAAAMGPPSASDTYRDGLNDRLDATVAHALDDDARADSDTTKTAADLCQK